MLTCTYRRHRPNSSSLVELVERNPLGQVKGLEHGWIGEYDVAGDPATGDREHLERVQPMPAAGLRRVRGQRWLAVGRQVPITQPGPRILNTRRMNRP